MILAPLTLYPLNIVIRKTNDLVKSHPQTIKQGLTDSKLSGIIDLLAPLRDLPKIQEKLETLELKVGSAPAPKQFTPPAATVGNSFEARIPKASVTLTEVSNLKRYSFSDETIDYLKLPSFNNWQWEENEMTYLLEEMFYELGLMDHYNIELRTVRIFLHTVRENYNLNPFHNFRHCFCVTQMVIKYH